METRAVSTGGKPRRVGWWLILGAWIGVAIAGQAHDLWIEPSAPLAARGDELILHLHLGNAFVSEEERPLQDDHVSRFDFFSDRAGRRDLLATGKDGQLPAAKIRLESGAGLVVMDRVAQPITMPADKFNRYLADEGLDAIAALRTRLGQTDQPGREVYTRYLKTLVQERDLMAATPSTLYKRRVGQRLEILLESDPSRLKPNGILVVKVLFEGKALPNARVVAYHRTGNEPVSSAVTAITSADGLAEFKADQPGLWLVRLVHMRPSADKRPDAPAQWESFWAAYTFAVRSAPPVPPTPAAKEG